MKVYIVYFHEEVDCESTTKILGVFSSNEKAIDRVNQFEIEELDDFFTEEEVEKCGYEVNNHNNGYLEAHLNYDYHEININTKEVEVDSNLDWDIMKVI